MKINKSISLLLFTVLFIYIFEAERTLSKKISSLPGNSLTIDSIKSKTKKLVFDQFDFGYSDQFIDQNLLSVRIKF